MCPTTPDAHAGEGFLSGAGRELRHRLAWLGWALVDAFGAASCGVWCPGWVASDGWRAMRPTRAGRGAAGQPADALTAREIARGLRKIEAYLAAAALDRRPPASSDRADPDGGTAGHQPAG